MPHIHDQIDFVTDAYIVHDNRVLLVLHKKLKRWLPIGGHVELDEDTDQALFREIQEECGLQVSLMVTKPDVPIDPRYPMKPLFVPNYMNIHRVSDTHRHITLIFFATSDSGNATLAESEHDDIRWFSRTDLDDAKYDLDTAIKFYALAALDEAQKQ